MSNVESRMKSLQESQALDARYTAARAKLERNAKIENGQAGALVFAAMAYGDALDDNKLFQLATHWSKLICIAAVFVIPNLLVLRVLL